MIIVTLIEIIKMTVILFFTVLDLTLKILYFILNFRKSFQFKYFFNNRKGFLMITEIELIILYLFRLI